MAYLEQLAVGLRGDFNAESAEGAEKSKGTGLKTRRYNVATEAGLREVVDFYVGPLFLEVLGYQAAVAVVGGFFAAE